MSLPWYRVRHDILDHPKLGDLQAILGDPLADAYYHRLLAFCAKYAARGRLADGARTARAQLAAGVRWTRDPDLIVDAMIRVGLIEEPSAGVLEIHDWWEEQGPIVEKAERDAERKRTLRKSDSPTRRAPGARPARAKNAAGALPARVEETRGEESRDLFGVPIGSPDKDRKQSRAEAAKAWMDQERKRKTQATDEEIGPAHLNKALGDILHELGSERFRVTYLRYLEDRKLAAKSWPGKIFLSIWRRYVPTVEGLPEGDKAKEVTAEADPYADGGA